MTYKIGDKVELLGTKEGEKKRGWEIYFKNEGRIKGTIEKITKIIFDTHHNHYFLNNSSGYLTEQDFKKIPKNWKRIIEEEKK